MSVEKIQPLESLAARVARLRAEGRRVVFTNGCFDLLHSGHIELLEAARRHGDVLVVGINSDDSVRRLKGEQRPILGEAERARILAALEAVSFVCVFGEDTPLETIRELHPDVLVKGADWKDKGIVGADEVEGWGGETVVMRLVGGRSTTSIIDRIRTSDRSE
jgi:D-beta-D-heptose 7-phosphate kinase / D-beta-D-heptose 1-phosphate adenosyltransferase